MDGWEIGDCPAESFAVLAQENELKKESETDFAEEDATEKRRFLCGSIHSTEAPGASRKKEVTDLGVTTSAKTNW